MKAISGKDSCRVLEKHGWSFLQGSNMSITLDLPVKVESELAEATQEDGLTPNEIIAKALNDYLFVRKFRRLREKMLAQAEGTYPDEEIFEMVS